MKVTTKSFLSYTLLPGIIPMTRKLLASGFSNVAFYMAMIYGAVRLLPKGHPYLSAQNLGRFGISGVILEAARHLKFDRKHTDQICVFFMMFFGLILIIAQIGILLFSAFTQAAEAGPAMPTTYEEFFVTPNPDQDIAHIMMDRVFGIPDLFNSCVSTGGLCLESTVPDGAFPFPYHIALQAMLQFYSIGLLVIAALIFLYYIVVVVVETAQTGTPFGKRFNHVWAPIRMVVALGLLIPIAYGLNGAQLITLHIAKWGSAFATNGWTMFVETLVGTTATATLLGDADQLIATPNKPKPNALLQFYTVVAACVRLYELTNPELFDGGADDMDAYLLSGSRLTPGGGGAAPVGLASVPLMNNTWEQAVEYANNGDIVVAFGSKQDRYGSRPGSVMPLCGQVVMTTTDVYEPGSIYIQNQYYEAFIRRPWDNIANGNAMTTIATPALANGRDQTFFWEAAQRIIEYYFPGNDDGNAELPNQAAMSALVDQWNQDIENYIIGAVALQIGDGEWVQDVLQYGWAGAAIWYNKIAQMNGALVAGVSNIPMVKAWPTTMEYVLEEKRKSNQAIEGDTAFEPTINNQKIYFNNDDQVLNDHAVVLSEAYRLWKTGTMKVEGERRLPSSQNALIDLVNLTLGTEGLFSMVDNTDIHPLAQIVAMGRNLMDTAIRNMGVGVLAGGFSSIMGMVGNFATTGIAANTISSIAVKLGLMTICIGFVLAYVVPFMPFIFFFFQVCGWVKGVFEAMVGLPLWALAHIRIDGDGLPGHAAMNGYYLIFEIFLRPILIVFGLIAGISIFAAQVQVLNDIWYLVITNLTGFDEEAAKAVAGQNKIGSSDYARNAIDQLFYTVIYVIIVYMMGMASFKLVYLIPNHISDWMGHSVKNFGELDSDMPEHLVSKVYGSSQVLTQQTTSALNSLLQHKAK